MKMGDDTPKVPTEQYNSQFPVGFKTLLKIFAAQTGMTTSAFVVRAVLSTLTARKYIQANPDCGFVADVSPKRL